MREAIARECAPGALLPPGSGVLVACSGGADSVALAAAVAERRDLRASIGHVDHGLRAESAGEAEQVRSLAVRLGVPFFLERLDDLKQAVARDGLEAAARKGRYRALQNLALRADAALVATAHTRRDQAETVLLRLARGAGPAALAGVRARRPLSAQVQLVRPLLGVSRRATEQLCSELDLPVLHDPHNSDPARARARLRAAWPGLEESLSPNLEEAIARTASLLADEDELLAALAESALLGATGQHGLHLERLRALHPALLRRALILAARREGVRPEQAHLEQLRRLLPRRRFALSLPGGLATAAEGLLRFEHASAQTPARSSGELGEELAVEGPGSYPWQGRLLCVFEASAPGENSVDLARAPLPWTLRNQRPGDRFRPAGGRTKKVSDLWIDARVPRARRSSLAVLSDAAGILFYVEGLRTGEQSRGNLHLPQAFALRPEMDVPGARFPSLRPGDSASVTMTPKVTAR